MASGKEKQYTLCILCKPDISSSVLVKISSELHLELLDIKSFDPNKDYAMFLTATGSRRNMSILFVMSETEYRLVHDCGELSEALTLLSFSDQQRNSMKPSMQ